MIEYSCSRFQQILYCQYTSEDEHVSFPCLCFCSEYGHAQQQHCRSLLREVLSCPHWHKTTLSVQMHGSTSDSEAKQGDDGVQSQFIQRSPLGYLEYVQAVVYILTQLQGMHGFVHCRELHPLVCLFVCSGCQPCYLSQAESGRFSFYCMPPRLSNFIRRVFRPVVTQLK